MTKQIRTPSDLVHVLEQRGAITIYGPHALVVARRAIEQVLTEAGYSITFDPTSAPDLMDYLTVTSLSALEGAIAGAGLGALLGLLFQQPAVAAAVGAGLGGLAGAGRGVQRVASGWRVRAVWDTHGTPIVTINALKAASR